MVVTDSQGVISATRAPETMNRYKHELASITRPKEGVTKLPDVTRGRDVFIGVSGVRNLMTADMVRSMSKDAVILPLTTPIPRSTRRRRCRRGEGDSDRRSYNLKQGKQRARLPVHEMRPSWTTASRISQQLLVNVAYALQTS